MKYFKNPEQIFKNLIILLVSLGIFVSPFVVDYSSLPKGYELPKVHFWQIFCVIVIFIGILHYLFSSYKSRSLIFNRDFLIPVVINLVFSISTLVSPYREISLYGNSFRDQGLITHTLMIFMAYAVFKSVSHRNFHLIATSLILSALAQSFYSFNQFFKLIQEDPKLILEGYWINGTFGQANFFSGRLMLGIIFIGYYLGRKIEIKVGWLIKLALSLFGLIIATALLISLSIWGIITTSIALITILLYEILPKKVFAPLFYLLTAIGLILGGIFLARNNVYNLRIDIWQNIFQISFGQPLTQKSILHMFFGFGFDVMGNVFKDYGKFQGLLIDRAHNFILDIQFQNGFLLLAGILALITYPFVKLRKLVGNRKFTFLFFALFFWLLRSFIHESGIINLVDFLIILAACLAFTKIAVDHSGVSHRQ